jgi:hypothetical protein
MLTAAESVLFSLGFRKPTEFTNHESMCHDRDRPQFMLPKNLYPIRTSQMNQTSTNSAGILTHEDFC